MLGEGVGGNAENTVLDEWGPHERPRLTMENNSRKEKKLSFEEEIKMYDSLKASKTQP